MEPSDLGMNNLLSNLRSDGASVPWTPREIRADRRLDSPQWEAVPFVVQAGPSMLMIGLAESGWILAELRFDRERCTFHEVRRATYTWPREAFGVLLSRLAPSEPGPETVDLLTHEFAAWVGHSFARMPM